MPKLNDNLQTMPPTETPGKADAARHVPTQRPYRDLYGRGMVPVGVGLHIEIIFGSTCRHRNRVGVYMQNTSTRMTRAQWVCSEPVNSAIVFIVKRFELFSTEMRHSKSVQLQYNK